MRNLLLPLIKILGLLTFLILPTFSFSQFYHIDKNAQTVPDSLHTYQQIAHHLTKDLETDLEKVRAIFVWITHNIEYDVESYENGEVDYELNLLMIDQLLRSRKGVCGQYSYLFQLMSQEVGITNHFVGGYSKESLDGHAWNVVLIDGDYFLFDATWSAGGVANSKFIQRFDESYFMAPPEFFVESHLPEDPMWQLLDNPITLKEFLNQDFKKLEEKGNFNFNDTIKVHFEKNEFDQKISSFNRSSSMEILQIAKEGNFESMYRKINMTIANYANTNYNLASDIHYNFINAKRRFFRKPKLNKADVKNIISRADVAITNAISALDKVEYHPPEHKEWYDDLTKRVGEYEEKIELEKRFVKKYLKTPKIFRPFVIIFVGG